MKILMVLAMGVLVVAATTAKAMDSDAILGAATREGPSPSFLYLPLHFIAPWSHQS